MSSLFRIGADEVVSLSLFQLSLAEPRWGSGTVDVKSRKPRSTAQIRVELQHVRETFLSLASHHCPTAQLDQRGAELRELTERLLGLLNELALAREGRPRG